MRAQARGRVRTRPRAPAHERVHFQLAAAVKEAVGFSAQGIFRFIRPRHSPEQQPGLEPPLPQHLAAPVDFPPVGRGCEGEKVGQRLRRRKRLRRHHIRSHARAAVDQHPGETRVFDHGKRRRLKINFGAHPEFLKGDQTMLKFGCSHFLFYHTSLNPVFLSQALVANLILADHCA